MNNVSFTLYNIQTFLFIRVPMQKKNTRNKNVLNTSNSQLRSRRIGYHISKLVAATPGLEPQNSQKLNLTTTAPSYYGVFVILYHMQMLNIYLFSSSKNILFRIFVPLYHMDTFHLFMQTHTQVLQGTSLVNILLLNYLCQ